MTITAKAAGILEELVAVREKLDAVPGLQERQKKLYERGARAGLTAADMARAMRPDGDHEHLAESIRQHLRPLGLSKRATKKGPQKRSVRA